ncbi:Protein SSUH2 [Liparis tanakae]|uniref:Protein SSUH2 n=1 Tax=Liparis tanakae TaxID=230148 RepID=A0A4Z2FNK1_9TELE|nr:Protein SSUH2 [Liparis tanakae]
MSSLSFLRYFRSHQNRNYGLANPGYVPTAEGAPAMFAPPAAGFAGPSAPPAGMFDSVPGYEGTVAGGGGTYRLETFTESRSTEWTHEPYNGQPVDAFAQPPPGPWDLPAKTPSFFVDDKQTMKVPYTSSMKSVSRAAAPVIATEKIDATTAAAEGGPSEKSPVRRRYRAVAAACWPTLTQRCSFCHGEGAMQCDTCHGKQQLLVYIHLTVKWTNNSDDYVVEQSSGLQVDNLSKVSGKELFRDSQYLVYPVMGFPDPAVVGAAQRLVSEHQGKHSATSRILQQRQTIELIPVTKVTYAWKGKSHLYFVYGNEFKVNADNYPATCCCAVM